MSTLSKYVLRAHIAPAAAGLAIFYFVLSMDFIVDYLNLFIAKGVPGLAVLEAFLLSLAWMTVLAVPMAVMVAVLTAFGRLSGDNEITAAKATGVNVFSLIAPVLVASVIVAFGLFLFGNHVLPAANHRLKALLVDIHRIRPLATIEPGILTDLPGGYSILVDSLDSRTSEIFDVKIHRMEGESRSRPSWPKAAGSAVSHGDDYVRLELLDGEIHELDPDDATRYNRLLFERHVINVEQGNAELMRSDGVRRGDRELSLAELGTSMEQGREEAAAARDELADGLETHLAGLARPSRRDPPACPDPPTFAPTADACSGAPSPTSGRRPAPRGRCGVSRSSTTRSSRSRSLASSSCSWGRLSASGAGAVASAWVRASGILFFLIYYLFLVGGEQLGDRGHRPSASGPCGRRTSCSAEWVSS